jgi:DNA-binding CsgD family transcriptional regulator
VAPLILSAYGLTAREGEVARLVLQGLPTRTIADGLVISPLTVQQHLKSIFTKTGVTSRRELTAKIFSEQYLPRIMTGAQPSARGWFANV